jgi:hypothetical protein
MLKRIVVLTAVLAFSCFAFGQKHTKQVSKASSSTSPDATTTCAATFSSGSGVNATKYCVTTNGNITQFSRAGTEYIQVGDFGEGYGICDVTTSTPVGYFDYASSDSGNLGTSTFSSTAAKATSTRVTSDGIWQITNTITKVAANASSPGSAKITMQLKNETGADHLVLLLRHADADFSQGGVDDFDNDFDFTLDTAYGLEPGSQSGLSLTNNTFSNEIPHLAFTQLTSSGPDPCNFTANVAPQPFFGDGSIDHIYELFIPKFGKKSVTLTYKPM